MKKRSKITILLACTLVIGPWLARADSDPSAEYRVKLAFLYHFAQFIEWPADAFTEPGAPLLLCVEGSDPFKGEVEQSLSGRTVDGHPLRIKKLNAGEDPRACHIVFVRGTERKSGKILPMLQGTHTLTVGERSGFAADGGVINFVFEENNLRFEINLAAATQSPLKFSSKLLSVARIVKPEQTF